MSNTPTDSEHPWQVIAREIAVPSDDFRRDEHPNCDPDPSQITENANPAAAYLRSLESRAGRDSQRTAVDAIARWCLTGSFDDAAHPRQYGPVGTSGRTKTSDRPSPAFSFPWWRLRARHTEQIAAALREATKKIDDGRGEVSRFAPATRKRMLAALRRTLRMARRAGMMTLEHQVQACDLDRVRGERAPKGRALETDESSRLLAACSRAPSNTARVRDAAAVALLLFAGVRREEASTLRVEKIDFEAPKIVVRGKGDRDRVIPLPDAAVPPLRAWLDLRGEQPGPFLLRVHRSGKIDWGKGDGKLPPAMSGDAIFKLVRRVARRAGIDAVAPHDCRRTYVSQLLDRGADITVVARLAGHKSVATTQKYDRRGAAAEQAAVKLLDAQAAPRKGTQNGDT